MRGCRASIARGAPGRALLESDAMYDRLESPDRFDHGRPPRVGVLLSNLGTPDAATPGALRVYLKEFLSDPRVIELPRWKWLPILHLFILTTRPKMSAELYRKVWAKGDPGVAVTLDLRDGAAARSVTVTTADRRRYMRAGQTY